MLFLRDIIAWITEDKKMYRNLISEITEIRTNRL